MLLTIDYGAGLSSGFTFTWFINIGFAFAVLYAALFLACVVFNTKVMGYNEAWMISLLFAMCQFTVLLGVYVNGNLDAGSGIVMLFIFLVSFFKAWNDWSVTHGDITGRSRYNNKKEKE